MDIFETSVVGNTSDWQIIREDEELSALKSALNPRGEREKDLLETLDLVSGGRAKGVDDSFMLLCIFAQRMCRKSL